MYKVEIYIRGERLDLFDDENIEVVSSVQKIEDISRTFNDFSQSFTVPASPNNNKIFKHWYNFSINNGFDARIRHKGHIDIQGSNFKVGSFRLESCKIENNKPSHYKLTFFGQLIDLKETIGDDYLSSLDLSGYDIEYSSANVITGLTTGFFGGDLVFPLISTKRQFLYDSNASNNTDLEKLVNIADNGSGVGFDWSALRPALKVIPIIEAIESKYEITLSRDFFGRDVIQNLYLWLANEETEETLLNVVRATNYDSLTNSFPNIGEFNNETGAYIPFGNNAARVDEFNVRVDSSDGVEYTVQLMNNDEVLQEKTGIGDIDLDLNLPTASLQEGAKIYVRFKAQSGKVIDSINFRVQGFQPDFPFAKTSFHFADRTTPINITSPNLSPSNLMPSIKVIDFLKSLNKKYNLTVEPTSETEFTIKQLDDWYADGNIYDISKYVDKGKEIQIERPKIFKDISFKFQESTTILGEAFRDFNNTGYGDLETKIKTSDGTVLDGEEFEVELVFEQMIYEKLLDLNTNNETNIVYGLSLNKSLSETLPDGHLLYIKPVNVSANPLSIIDDTATQQTLNGNVFMPSHTFDNKAYSTTFGSEIDEHDGGVITNSLYNLFYRDYITDSFNIKRRKVSLEARLPMWLLTSLQLNDRLVIDGDRYIINEMTTNATNQRTKFTLLNDIYNLEANVAIEEETPPDPTPEDPPPPVAGSFSISATGGVSQSVGCSLVPNTTKYWDGIEADPTLADVIYNNQNMTSVFNGGNNYYKIRNDKAIRINSNGVVMDVYFCGQGEGGGNQ